MKLSQITESKKTHDECSDDIDALHKSAVSEFAKVKPSKETKLHFDNAMKKLKKAQDLALNWNKRCG